MNNDASILVRGDTTIKGRNVETEVAFKNCVPFIKCIIERTIIDDAEDLDLVMPIYNLSIYSDTTDSLWFYSKGEPINFKYKNKLLWNTVAQPAPKTQQ